MPIIFSMAVAAYPIANIGRNIQSDCPACNNFGNAYGELEQDDFGFVIRQSGQQDGQSVDIRGRTAEEKWLSCMADRRCAHVISAQSKQVAETRHPLHKGLTMASCLFRGSNLSSNLRNLSKKKTLAAQCRANSTQAKGTSKISWPEYLAIRRSKHQWQTVSLFYTSQKPVYTSAGRNHPWCSPWPCWGCALFWNAGRRSIKANYGARFVVLDD
jgi:hypothetical protein